MQSFFTKQKLQLAAILFTLCVPAFASAFPCLVLSEIFDRTGAQAYEGNEKEFPELALTYPDSKFFFLGAGMMGGSVIRVVPNSGAKPIVVKLYYEQNRLKNDVAMQANYQEIFKNKGIFEVANYRHVKEDLVEIENIEGVTLWDLINSPRITIVEQAKLVERQIDLLNQAKQLFEDWVSNPTAERQVGKDGFKVFKTYWGDWRLSGSFTEKNTTFDVLIKPDNIIATADGRLVIIDPY